MALEAGVSPATVSRVINSSARVSEEHREAVQAAIARLGYVPNQSARGLVTRRTSALALVVRETLSFGVSDPYVSATMIAASQSLIGTGIHLVVLAARDDAEQQSVADYVVSGHFDGVLLVSVHDGDPLPERLLHAGVPFVFCGASAVVLPGVCSVDCDNPGGGRLVAERFLAAGRRRVVAIGGPTDMPASAGRIAGLQAGLEAGGAQLLDLAHGAWTRTSGEQAMHELLLRQPDLDAVFVASDAMAVGALRALAKAERRVPRDVAVIGFDDVELAEYAAPPLTTVRQPIAEQAQRAVEALLHQLRTGEPAAPVVLPTELVLRVSA
ncbi:LacI family DNA-binding transcriptional regulator [Kineococcus xinjiangensis]|uniref:LacI family DNA-binding transcriptional regulator n=1 Tax=Kineococcus xinjiangensis TaxID=512762 RepID=UPI001B8093AA|nr:LacI family DNA-binding transcriptional regulator [Kineococcus xinjiangensis]